MSAIAVISGSSLGRPLAYSYVRFSRPEQIKGDSLRRQLAKSAAYAEEKSVHGGEKVGHWSGGVMLPRAE